MEELRRTVDQKFKANDEQFKQIQYQLAQNAESHRQLQQQIAAVTAQVAQAADAQRQFQADSQMQLAQLFAAEMQKYQQQTNTRASSADFDRRGPAEVYYHDVFHSSVLEHSVDVDPNDNFNCDDSDVPAGSKFSKDENGSIAEIDETDVVVLKEALDSAERKNRKTPVSAPELFDESPKKNSERYVALCKIPDEQRKVLDCVHDTYKLDLEGNDLVYDSRIVSTFGAFPRVKLKFNALFGDIALIMSNGNCNHDHANEQGLTCFAIDFLIASAFSLLFVYSLGYARTRPVNGAKAAKKGGERQFNGLVDVYKKTLKSDGVAGLYRGFDISCVGIIVYRGLYIGMYDSLKPVLIIGKLQDSFFASFALGWVITNDAGTSSSMITSHLFNIIKCLFETADRTDGSDSKLRSAAYETVNEVVRCSNLAECSQIFAQLLPVIMLLANSDLKLVMKGITHGACDYLVPVQVEELRNIGQHVVRKRVNQKKSQPHN